MVLPEAAKERMRRLEQMTMDEVAEVAAGNPGAVSGYQQKVACLRPPFVVNMPSPKMSMPKRASKSGFGLTISISPRSAKRQSNVDAHPTSEFINTSP